MSDESNNNHASDESRASFSSKLQQGRQRFLAHVIEHSLSLGRRSPEDFIRHFPPEAIMKGLEQQPALRGKILSLTTGIKLKIATKKSFQSAAEDLRIALEEKETDAASVVSAFDPDDRVLYLEDTKLWAFVIEGNFWSTPPKQKEAYARAKAHVAYMLDRALVDELVTHRGIVEGITVEQLVACLPKSELGKIIEGALANAHKNVPFTEVDLLATRPPSVLVEYVPLTHIYDAVIAPKIAKVHGYVDGPKSTAPAVMDTPRIAEAAEPPAEREDWVEVSDSERPSDDDEIGDEDFASP
jgi:hypothetical protein